jgi:hypothetical protein
MATNGYVSNTCACQKNTPQSRCLAKDDFDFYVCPACKKEFRRSDLRSVNFKLHFLLSPMRSTVVLTMIVSVLCATIFSVCLNSGDEGDWFPTYLSIVNPVGSFAIVALLPVCFLMGVAVTVVAWISLPVPAEKFFTALFHRGRRLSDMEVAFLTQNIKWRTYKNFVLALQIIFAGLLLYLGRFVFVLSTILLLLTFVFREEFQACWYFELAQVEKTTHSISSDSISNNSETSFVIDETETIKT